MDSAIQNPPNQKQKEEDEEQQQQPEESSSHSHHSDAEEEKHSELFEDDGIRKKEMIDVDDNGPLDEENGRERLKRHRMEVAGRVWIPEIWGQEELLKDWIDCCAFEASFVPHRIMSARSALAQQATTADSRALKSCKQMLNSGI